MISLNEIAVLINQIDAILDEADGEVTSLHIVHNEKSKVWMPFTAFLSEFVDFEIEVFEDSAFPYRLSKVITGVQFSTSLKVSEAAGLEITMPEQFEYISKKLQEEPKKCPHENAQTINVPGSYEAFTVCHDCGIEIT